MRRVGAWLRMLVPLNAVLIAGAGLLGAALLWRGGVVPKPSIRGAAPTEVPDVVCGKEDVLDAARLRGLFRESAAGEPGIPAAGVDPGRDGSDGAAIVPESEAELLGTVYGSPSLARAIIVHGREQAQEIYSVGDAVAGYRLSEVGRDFVILEGGGRKVRLEMQVAMHRAAADDVTAVPLGLSQGDAGAIVGVLAPDSLEINRNAFHGRVGGIGTLMRRAELSPHMDNGKMAGIRMGGIENVRFARFLGLQDGDVLQAVNGQRLTGMQKALQVMRKARGQRELRVSLLRDGEVKEMCYSLR